MKDYEKIVEERNKQAEKFQIQDEEEIDVAIQACLEHLHGRRFLWWLLELGGMMRNPHTNNALSTAFNCGEMNVSQRILDRILTVNSAGYAQMIQERENERRDRDTILGAAGDTDGDD